MKIIVPKRFIDRETDKLDRYVPNWYAYVCIYTRCIVDKVYFTTHIKTKIYLFLLQKPKRAWGHPFCSQVIIAILFLGPRTHVLRVERAVEEIWAGLQVWGGCLSTLQYFIISYPAIRTRNLNSFKMLTVVKYAYCFFNLVSLLELNLPYDLVKLTLLLPCTGTWRACQTTSWLTAISSHPPPPSSW